MLKYLVFISLVLGILLIVGCAGKKQQADVGQEESDAAIAERLPSVQPSALAFYDSLNEQQMNTLISSKSVILPYQSLDDKQKSAFEEFVNKWHEAMPAGQNDIITELRKSGADTQMSNVEIEFKIRKSGITSMFLMVKQPDGSSKLVMPVGLGQVTN